MLYDGHFCVHKGGFPRTPPWFATVCSLVERSCQWGSLEIICSWNLHWMCSKFFELQMLITETSDFTVRHVRSGLCCCSVQGQCSVTMTRVPKRGRRVTLATTYLKKIIVFVFCRMKSLQTYSSITVITRLLRRQGSTIDYILSMVPRPVRLRKLGRILYITKVEAHVLDI